MGCFILLIGIIWPRITLVLLWLFTNYSTQAFQTYLWPILGFCFLPTTTLGYELAKNWASGGQLTGLWWLLPALGLLHDLGHTGWAASRRGRNRNT